MSPIYDYREPDVDGQKTVVAYIVGLLCGGLLIWVFSGDAPNYNSDANYEICGDIKCYNIESYTKESNCVFMAEEEVRVCGNYTIKKLNTEE